jgi:acetyl-CoA synthetase
LADEVAADARIAHSLVLHDRERLAPFQRVRRVECIEPPKTMSGKIRRPELRARENEAVDDQLCLPEDREHELSETSSTVSSTTGGT